MNRILLLVLACTGGLITPMAAQSARLDVRTLGEGKTDSRLPQNVQNATKTAAIAPKLRLEATVSSFARAPLAASLEWYVLGRPETPAAGGATPPDFVLMQASKESVTARPSPGVKTTFFAYSPGQVRNGVRSDGWAARLVGADGRLLDAKASHAFFLALVRDPARLDALVAAKAGAEGTGPAGEVVLPADVAARIKAEAESKWPGNDEMQAFEIKNLTDAHKAAYRK